MKKIIAILLVLVMVFGMVACGGGSDTELDDEQLGTEQDVNDNADQDTETDEDSDADNDTDQPANPPADDTDKTPEVDTPDQQPSGETVGQILLKDFNDRVAADSTTYSLAEAIIANPIIKFFGGATPMEVGGWLPGLGEGTITGYKEVTSFGPMMGSIAFIGYIFELEDGTDAAAFEQSLKENADPRWQICVTADETTIDTNGKFVFFLMSPAQFPEEPADDMAL